MDDWRQRLIAELAIKRSEGLNLGELGERIGKNRDYPTRVTKPGSNPGIENLRALCEAADLDFSYVMTGHRLRPANKELVEKAGGLATSRLAELQRMLEGNPLQQSVLPDDDQ